MVECPCLTMGGTVICEITCASPEAPKFQLFDYYGPLDLLKFLRQRGWLVEGAVIMRGRKGLPHHEDYSIVAYVSFALDGAQRLHLDLNQAPDLRDDLGLLSQTELIKVSLATFFYEGLGTIEESLRRIGYRVSADGISVYENINGHSGASVQMVAMIQSNSTGDRKLLVDENHGEKLIGALMDDVDFAQPLNNDFIDQTDRELLEDGTFSSEGAGCQSPGDPIELSKPWVEDTGIQLVGESIEISEEEAEDTFSEVLEKARLLEGKHDQQKKRSGAIVAVGREPEDDPFYDIEETQLLDDEDWPSFDDEDTS
ncbi:MAG: hypothetical protein ABIG32_01015 [Candidatus Uhrbacteria bacterium]